VSVALILFTIQWIISLSGIYNDYNVSISNHIKAEKALVTGLVKGVDDRYEEVPDLVLSETVIGIVLISGANELLIEEGETVGFMMGEESSESLRFVDSTEWLIQTPMESLTAIAYINTKGDVALVIQHALQLFVLALITSLLAGAIAMLCTFRFYVLPMEQLIVSLQQSRAESDGGLPELIDMPDRTDLKNLAEEINNLIEGQRKSARQLKVKQQYLEYTAHHDPLTHLPNRLMFDAELKKTVQSAIADERHFSVFLVDLDNFKFFNDQYGHDIGDKMVTEVANRLRTQISRVDVVARLDGDEFVVLQRDVNNEESVESVAARILNIVSEPLEYRGFTLKVGVSVGISRFPNDVLTNQNEDLLGEEVLNNATVAMQEAKNAGKGHFQLFNEKMRSDLSDRINLERDLKQALLNDEFEVYYQPKINISTKEVTGAEALVRWKHPEKGYISPEDFVPVAEETGLIIQLGEWILRTSCKRMRELQNLGYTGLTVAVNISAVQFTDGNLLPMIVSALEDSGLNPELLELEITESAVMHDPAEVIESLHQLSAHGMKLAIDDFGTGYSSLAYLKKFPVDTLKIDKAFITDVSSDNDDVAIVEAILGLGKHFNMKIIAEGIEDEDQLNFLHSQGCDIAQGYFVSKPLQAAQYEEWLMAWPHGVQQPVQEIQEASVSQLRTGTDG